MMLMCSHTRAQVLHAHLEAVATARLFEFRVVHVCKTRFAGKQQNWPLLDLSPKRRETVQNTVIFFILTIIQQQTATLYMPFQFTVLDTRNNFNRKQFQARNIMQKQCTTTKPSNQLASVHILHHKCYLAAYAKVLPKNQRIPQEGTPIRKKFAPKGNGGKQQYCAKHTSRVHSFLLSCVTGGTWATVTP